MPAEELMLNMVSDLTGINSRTIKQGNLNASEWERVQSAMAKIQDNLLLDDTPSQKISTMKRKAKKFKRKGGLDLIIIDYLQIAGPENPKLVREQQISQMSGDCKTMAKELNVPVIALSQLGRQVEERKVPIPILSDLRESGAIEQDADAVIFIFRPEYYNILQDAEGNDVRGLAKLIVAKHRGGPVGECKVKFIPHLTKFEDYKENNPMESLFGEEGTDFINHQNTIF
jgi:replicative DNA helicase